MEKPKPVLLRSRTPVFEMANDGNLGNEIAKLAEDLIMEILAKLPVKSLLRFRCVCKTWYVLIKSPNFINLHLKHHKKNDSILVIPKVGYLSNLMSLHCYESLNCVSPHVEIPYYCVVPFEVGEPCNGLVSLLHRDKIILCNPAMREFKVLPPRPFSCSEEGEFHIVAIGFGFDTNTNDYKVVTIVRLYPSDEDADEAIIFVDKAEIYNLSTNSWREIDFDNGLPKIYDSIGYGALLNGAFHWVAYGQIDGKFTICILSFDMSTEVFRHMEFPHDVRLKEHLHLTVLNKYLALFAFTLHCSSPEFVDIWVMDEYGETKSWRKQFVVGPVNGMHCPLLLWKNAAILLESVEGQLVSCAVDTHEMNDFDIHGTPKTLTVCLD